NTILRTIGGAFGAQIASAIVTSNTLTGTTTPAPGGYTLAFTISAIALATAAIAALIGRTRRLTDTTRWAPSKGVVMGTHRCSGSDSPPTLRTPRQPSSGLSLPRRWGWMWSV